MAKELSDVEKLSNYLNHYLDPEDPEVLNDLDVMLPNDLIGDFDSFDDKQKTEWLAKVTEILRDDIEIELVGVLDREDLRPVELNLVNTRIKSFLENQGFRSPS